jgi:hypothetical protein
VKEGGERCSKETEGSDYNCMAFLHSHAWFISVVSLARPWAFVLGRCVLLLVGLMPLFPLICLPANHIRRLLRPRRIASRTLFTRTCVVGPAHQRGSEGARLLLGDTDDEVEAANALRRR